jgi:uncharacterized membrane protein
MRIMVAGGFAALMLAGAAQAEVVEQTDGGFRTRNVVEISAPADRVYAALGEVGRWWNGAHSYSGNAANLTMPLTAGGCFCETVGKGGVRHGVVVQALPGQLVRIEGALGPLQDEGASGALSFAIRPKGAGVEVVQTYNVGGLRPATAKGFAAPVDQVVREQLVRFEKYVETGKPD